MSEHKPHQFRPALYAKEATVAEEAPAAGNEQNGWDAYRKWLSRVSAKPTGERTPLDHSIYSWRGYHTWADKIRQNWKEG
jgi:hypothetical protein